MKPCSFPTPATALVHDNGVPVARIFGPADTTRRGGTIAFDLRGPDKIPYNAKGIERLATAARISLRTGCFCNPGDGEVAHGITREIMAQCFVGRPGPVTFEECSSTLGASTGKPPNTVRISLGLASNFADVFAFMAFVGRFVDVPSGALPAAAPGARTVESADERYSGSLS